VEETPIMAHTHEHDENYFLDQIFGIAMCGALGGIAVLLYVRQTMLKIILDPSFHPWVLAGGIGLLVMVAIRAVAIWKLAGHTPAHDHHHHDHHDHAHHHPHDHGHHHHDHNHGHHHHHDHAHDHEHSHAHGHGHDHEHAESWSPVKYMVLALPIVLFILNLPNNGFTPKYKDLQGVYPAASSPAAKTATEIGLGASPLAPAPLLVGTSLPEDEVLGLRFSELERAAYDERTRKHYEGKLGTLEGMLVASPDKQHFNIVRYRMNCCAADALAISAAILVDPNWNIEPEWVNERHQRWVKVKGRIHFFLKPNSAGEYVGALLVIPDKDNPPYKLVEIIQSPENPYAD
jgi:hypothetical protein